MNKSPVKMTDMVMQCSDNIVVFQEELFKLLSSIFVIVSWKEQKIRKYYCSSIIHIYSVVLVPWLVCLCSQLLQYIDGNLSCVYPQKLLDGFNADNGHGRYAQKPSFNVSLSSDALPFLISGSASQLVASHYLAKSFPFFFSFFFPPLFFSFSTKYIPAYFVLISLIQY